ncbi:hypothetical protein HDZ31DRAFT_68045 [Schizophyllum fasciatum]
MPVPIIIIIIYTLLLEQYELLLTELSAFVAFIARPLDLFDAIYAAITIIRRLLIAVLAGRGPHRLACRLITVFALTVSLVVAVTLHGIACLSRIAWDHLCALVGTPSVVGLRPDDAASLLTSDHTMAEGLLCCMMIHQAKQARPSTTTSFSDGALPSDSDCTSSPDSCMTDIDNWRFSVSVGDDVKEEVSVSTSVMVIEGAAYIFPKHAITSVVPAHGATSTRAVYFSTTVSSFSEDSFVKHHPEALAASEGVQAHLAIIRCPVAACTFTRRKCALMGFDDALIPVAFIDEHVSANLDKDENSSSAHRNEAPSYPSSSAGIFDTDISALTRSTAVTSPDEHDHRAGAEAHELDVVQPLPSRVLTEAQIDGLSKRPPLVRSQQYIDVPVKVHVVISVIVDYAVPYSKGACNPDSQSPNSRMPCPPEVAPTRLRGIDSRAIPRITITRPDEDADEQRADGSKAISANTELSASAATPDLASDVRHLTFPQQVERSLMARRLSHASSAALAEGLQRLTGAAPTEVQAATTSLPIVTPIASPSEHASLSQASPSSADASPPAPFIHCAAEVERLTTKFRGLAIADDGYITNELAARSPLAAASLPPRYARPAVYVPTTLVPSPARVAWHAGAPALPSPPSSEEMTDTEATETIELMLTEYVPPTYSAPGQALDHDMAALPEQAETVSYDQEMVAAAEPPQLMTVVKSAPIDSEMSRAAPLSGSFGFTIPRQPQAPYANPSPLTNFASFTAGLSIPATPVQANKGKAVDLAERPHAYHGSLPGADWAKCAHCDAQLVERTATQQRRAREEAWAEHERVAALCATGPSTSRRPSRMAFESVSVASSSKCAIPAPAAAIVIPAPPRPPKRRAESMEDVGGDEDRLRKRRTQIRQLPSPVEKATPRSTHGRVMRCLGSRDQRQGRTQANVSADVDTRAIKGSILSNPARRTKTIPCVEDLFSTTPSPPKSSLKRRADCMDDCEEREAQRSRRVRSADDAPLPSSEGFASRMTGATSSSTPKASSSSRRRAPLPASSLKRRILQREGAIREHPETLKQCQATSEQQQGTSGTSQPRLSVVKRRSEALQQQKRVIKRSSDASQERSEAQQLREETGIAKAHEIWRHVAPLYKQRFLARAEERPRSATDATSRSVATPGTPLHTTSTEATQLTTPPKTPRKIAKRPQRVSAAPSACDLSDNLASLSLSSTVTCSRKREADDAGLADPARRKSSSESASPVFRIISTIFLSVRAIYLPVRACLFAHTPLIPFAEAFQDI